MRGGLVHRYYGTDTVHTVHKALGDTRVTNMMKTTGHKVYILLKQASGGDCGHSR